MTEATAFVGVTDREWFDLLRVTPGIDEVNFWQPSAATGFQALREGQPFLFKLHSPANYVVGGGFFVYWTRLPVSLAWGAFGVKNGATTLLQMRARIEKYRQVKPAPQEDYEIGCILLAQPFFFSPEQWIPVPSDWKRNIVRGKAYDLSKEPGRSLWAAVTERMALLEATEVLPQGIHPDAPFATPQAADPQSCYGSPIVIQPRLGQGLFRVMVTDAYQRRCAISQEKVLPVLEAAHIRPYSEGGEHRVDNGLLLRSDLHILFDKGYVTVTPDHRVEVSSRLKSDFENGREYYRWHGGLIVVPQDPRQRPSQDFLVWHNEQCFIP